MKFGIRETGEWANVLLEEGCFQSEGYWDWKKKKRAKVSKRSKNYMWENWNLKEYSEREGTDKRKKKGR